MSSQNPCPSCQTSRQTLEATCENCGWTPGKPRGEPTCEYCHRICHPEPTNFHQNTGLLIVRIHREYSGLLCKSCAMKTYLKTSLHNLTIGLFGLTSLILGPYYFLTNTLTVAGRLMRR